MQAYGFDGVGKLMFIQIFPFRITTPLLLLRHRYCLLSACLITSTSNDALDWEYPGAYDRGGGPADTENYVTFMKALKSAFAAGGYGISFTAPSSYW